MRMRTMWATLVTAVVGAGSFLPFATAQSTNYALSDLSWSLSNANGSIAIPGQVPSDANLDLLRAGIITEPLLEANDFTQRWIISDNWTYTADISPFLSQVRNTSQNTLLLFHGIDTVANITLGGQPVYWVSNQFRQWTFNVTDIVSTLAAGSGNTNLTVAFESAWLYGMNTSTYTEYVFNSDFELPNARQWIRKDQSSFGWDWGPAFAPSGIHKPAYFVSIPTKSSSLNERPSGLFVEQSSVEIFRKGQQNSIEPDQTADWVVNVTLGLLAASDVTPTASISIPELGISHSGLALGPIPGAAVNATWVSASITVPNGVPQLWYPHNLGTPKLYNVTVTLSPGGETFTKTTGFRTIVLIQSPVPQSDVDTRGIIPGDQYHFTINGKAFYTSGTNVIPFDPFYARISTDAVRWVLQSAVLSGQNMLRVWGGGVYQPSNEDSGTYSFYDICDELGILAWSEMIFSDALYPINDFLLDNIIVEAQQNVIRTNHHPSMAQWAGGNEIEGIVMGTNTSYQNGTHYLDEFVTLFQDVLHDVVYQSSRSISYTDCSTTNGYLSLNPYILRFNNKTTGYLYGNSERYDYTAQDAFDYTTFPISRYVNEFGFLSMPSFYSWEEVLTSPDDFSFNSTIVSSRDHHNPADGLTWPNPNADAGQSQMTEAVQYWFPTPGTSDSNQTFAQWCWSTQVFQAMTMVSEVAFYRRGAGHPENNLGALVWQLNDVWQAPSWSSIEYSGRWKVLHYAEATIFTPVIVYPFWTASNQSLEVTATSDRWYTVNGTADLTWYNWNGTELNKTSYDFSVPTLNNSVLFSAVGYDSFLPSGTSANEVFMRLNSTATIEGGTVVTNEAIFNPTGLVNVTLVDPAIEVTNNDLTFTLTATGGVAAWAWIDHPAGTVGYFYDTTTNQPSNGFYLIPGQPRTLTFDLNTALSSNTSPDPADFVVRSMWNNTNL